MMKALKNKTELTLSVRAENVGEGDDIIGVTETMKNALMKNKSAGKGTKVKVASSNIKRSVGISSEPNQVGEGLKDAIESLTKSFDPTTMIKEAVDKSGDKSPIDNFKTIASIAKAFEKIAPSNSKAKEAARYINSFGFDPIIKSGIIEKVTDEVSKNKKGGAAFLIPAVTAIAKAVAGNIIDMGLEGKLTGTSLRKADKKEMSSHERNCKAFRGRYGLTKPGCKGYDGAGFQKKGMELPGTPPPFIGSWEDVP